MYGTSFWLNKKFASDNLIEMLKAYACFAHVDELMIPLLPEIMKDEYGIKKMAADNNTTVMNQLHIITIDFCITKITAHIETMNTTYIDEYHFIVDFDGTKSDIKTHD
jgi:hypothetical protein